MRRRYFTLGYARGAIRDFFSFPGGARPAGTIPADFLDRRRPGWKPEPGATLSRGNTGREGRVRISDSHTEDPHVY
jgi:hypothetical protein